MNIRKTILSEKEFKLLEDLIVKYGLIVNFEQIVRELKNTMKRQEIRNLTSKLAKNGWLVRIKKGTYYLANLESRGTVNVSVFVIAQTLLNESYVSFETALQYHGMFDQHLRTVTSVSLKRMKSKKVQDITYEFIITDKKNFYGFKEIQMEGTVTRIATSEKALLDMLDFRRTTYSIDLVLEKLKEHKNSLDFKKLNKFSRKQSVTVQRILGFLLDKANLNSNHLHAHVKDKSSHSCMTADSKNFNAKWRLYYHNHFK